MSTEEKKIPKGRLVIIGGNESKKPEKNPQGGNNHQNADFNHGILREILNEVKKNDPVIEIVPVASEDQEKMGKNYIGAFKKLNQKSKVIIIKDKKEFDNAENLRRIELADIVFFTGGDQVKLSETLSGTTFLKVIKNRYNNEDFIIAGSSSGAMVLSDFMITAGDSDEALLKGVIDTKKGLGLISNVIIDTHFLSRGRVSRLAESLLIHNNDIGLGICEDTGLIVTDGRFVRAIGSGTAVVMVASGIKNTNYHSVKEKDPVFIENLTLHLLAKGAGYDLHKRKFMIIGQNHTLPKEMQRA